MATTQKQKARHRYKKGSTVPPEEEANIEGEPLDKEDLKLESKSGVEKIGKNRYVIRT